MQWKYGCKKLVKQIKDPVDEAFVKGILKIKSTFDPHQILPIVERNGAHLNADLHLVDQFNKHPDQALLKEEYASIRKQMKALHMHEPFKKDKVIVYAFKGLILLLLAPIFIMSFLAHFIPIGIAVFLTKRYVKDKEFTTSVLTVSGAALVSILYLVLLIIFLFNNALLVWSIPVLFASLFVASNYVDIYRSFSDQFRGRMKPVSQWKKMYKSCKIFLKRLDINIE